MISTCFSRMRLTAGVLALALCLALARPAHAQQTDVHSRLQQSTGFVVVNKGNNQLGYGTCWVADQKQNLVVTNYHVVGKDDDVWVSFARYDNNTLITNSAAYARNDYIPGKVIYRDSKRDLALIRLDRLPNWTSTLQLAPTGLQVGQKIYAIGNSGMANKQLNTGTLWRQRAGTVQKSFFWQVKLAGTGQVVEAAVVQTDSGSKPGDSGGALVDANGLLVGVNSSTNENGDYAIDVSEVRIFLERALGGSPKTPHAAAGTWTLTWTHQDKDLVASLTLDANGTVLWYGGSTKYEGTYSYSDGKLTLNVPKLFITTVTLTWVDDNQCQFSIQFTDALLKFTATRR